MSASNGIDSLAELKALADIIKASVERIEQTVNAHSLTFPSPHTSFSPESEAARNLPEVIAAGSLISAAASQLSALVQPPPLTIISLAMQFHVSTAVRTAVDTHVAEILREAGPQGLHVRDIAKPTNVDPKKLARILRLLATNHVFVEVSPDVFTHNRLSSLLDSGKSVDSMLKSPETRYLGTLGLTAVIGHVTDEAFKSSSYLTETLLDPEFGHSAEPNKSAFNKAFNEEKDLWQFFERPGNEFRLSRFGSAMDGTKNLAPPGAILEGYDWKDLKEGALVVDCGGGVGSQSLTLAKTHPHLHFVVQDRPAVVENGVKFWNENLPGALDSGRVKLQAHDFFDPQPVKNADVFLVRMILHDWSDEFSVKILRRLREAATPDTRLIVVDQLMSYACEEETLKEIPGALLPVPPAPLLPNLGQDFAYYTDLQMMGFFNAQERTVTQFKELLEQGGWKLLAVHHGAPFAISSQKVIAAPI
ncbi:S-adenosyl-L-methionine-dependent methyltransferase [Artomyces pyxidatus]|uniref:S-adenosyl-L-methionine-dependent methyltransferase n=1 Tax=Artomyces pyxidatus TaxID=48021 RepID=A0ACB8SUS6_9AGAM|nr:S-adenosyl-L-methionine-dependent methyltransferase [Artomyces pyxidatus]